jgi:hypothetical protein
MVFIVANMVDGLCHSALLRRPRNLSLRKAKDAVIEAILAYVRPERRSTHHTAVDARFGAGFIIGEGQEIMENRRISTYIEVKVHVRFKLFALWTSIIFLYVYGDYFELYQPGKLQEMIAGSTAFGAISQGVLLGMSAIMVIPCLMPFLSLALPSGVCRWMNILFGATYTVIMMLAIRGGWHFYVLYGLLEIVLTGLVAWYAWTWPREAVH